MTKTTADIVDAILECQASLAGRVQYSETASTRLNSKTHADLSTPTDCSGMAAKMFAHFADINIGTYTGNECSYGELITRSKDAARAHYGMLRGDCILFDWDGDGATYASWDHIAIYAGKGRIWNHGGPGNGPLNWSLADSVNNAGAIMVRRFVPWAKDVVTHPPVGDHHHPNPNPMHGEAIPELIVRGTGDYYGLVTGPNRSHGGAYVSEQNEIKLIQRFLNWKLNSNLKVDGVFGPKMKAAVAEFQMKYMPHSGEVHFAEWHKMASL